ncbi:MAG: serine/threonine-protein kinase, partial [Thermoanaerobaculia bacterium]
MIGSRLGPYEITARLGAGGMGEVYEAKDLRLERKVAVKFLPADAPLTAEARRRFAREARAASAIDHPHICAVHDVGESDGRPYLVMERLEGETLAQRLTRGRLPLADWLRLGMQIADALEAAHGQGILHRDLKPGNVFVTRRGDAKVLDFGLAALAVDPAAATLDTSAAAPLTAPGRVMGTVAYMSPEQARGETLDVRSDVFS